MDKETIDLHAYENIKISADIENKSDVLCLTWQKETPDGDKALDITLPKYQGTKVNPDGSILCINGCEEADIGAYFLLTACKNGIEKRSNKIRLNASEGKTSFSYTRILDFFP